MSSSCNFGEHFHTKARLLKSDPALNSVIYDDVTNTASHFTITQCLMFVTTRCCSIIAFNNCIIHLGMDYSLYLYMPVNYSESMDSASSVT